MNRISSTPLAAIAIGVFSFFLGCQSDTPANPSDDSKTRALESKPDVVGGDQPAVGIPAKQMEEWIAELEKLKTAHEKFQEKILELRRQYDAIPTEVKKNAVHCDQLEAQMEGHIEKGNLRLGEMSQLILELRQGVEPNARNQPVNGVAQTRAETAIIEYRDDLPQIEAEYPAMQKAVAQLNASIPKRGKGVVLFQ